MSRKPRRTSDQAPAVTSWTLVKARARLSELVRRVEADGPQVITVRGRPEVVVMSAEAYRRLEGEPRGQALVDALASSPLSDLDLEREPLRAPVHGVEP